MFVKLIVKDLMVTETEVQMSSSERNDKQSYKNMADIGLKLSSFSHYICFLPLAFF